MWELAYAPASAIRRGTLRAGGGGRSRKVVRAVENFRFFDLRVYAFADPEGAVAEVKAEGRTKSTGRLYRQEILVLFLRAAGGQIMFLREYFLIPVRAAKALDTPILGLESEGKRRRVVEKTWGWTELILPFRGEAELNNCLQA